MPFFPALAPVVRVWRHRDYALFMGGMGPNLVTVWMQRVGAGWLAWELTHSPTWLGLVAAADLGPMLILALFAGTITDRSNPTWQIKITQALSLTQAAALATLTFAGAMTIELLFVLSLMLGCVHPFSSAARHTIVPATVPRSEFATAVALDSALFNGSRFVGPALAGILIPLTGVGGTFVANALGCAVFLAAICAMHLGPPDRSGQTPHNIIGGMRDGLAYVRAQPGIGYLFLLLTVASTFVRPIQDMLPGFAGAVFQAGAVGLAWLTSAMGVGAMVSAIWIAAYARLSGLTRVMMAGCLGIVLSTFGFVATSELWVGIVCAALWGFTLNTMSTSTQALVQSAVDDSMRGRVMSLFTLIWRGTPAVGAVISGALAESLGLRLTFAAAGAILLAAWVIAVPYRNSVTAALESDRH